MRNYSELSTTEKQAIDLTSFLKWQEEQLAQGQVVSVDIKIEPNHTWNDRDNHTNLSIYVYDYNAHVGNHVTSINEINFAAWKLEEDTRTLKRLAGELGFGLTTRLKTDKEMEGVKNE